MIHRTLCAAVAAAAPMIASAEDLSTKPVLSNALAQEMVAACFADQAASGYSNVNVFVVDDGGHLLAASRQDDACKACADIAENKAITSALYGAPTRVMGDLSFGEKRDGVDAGLPGAAFVPGIVAFAGGLPITSADGALLGGIGVSGASSDEDEQCAQAGIDAISASLN
jgi:uncharacterized protein GlcG (DUF336 family)